MENRSTRENIDAYKRLHTAALRIHKTAKRLAWRAYITKISDQTTQTDLWRTIRAFNGKSNTTRFPLMEENRLVFNIQKKADIHARYQQSTMSTERRFDYTLEDLKTIDAAANDQSYQDYNELFTLHELQDTIDELKSESAYGDDEIHNGFLKHLPPYKSTDLLGILNRIWRFGEYPITWKLALIIPILKPGKDPHYPASYRPISLLSCLSKVMDKMVCQRLTFHLESNNLLSKSQYGFRSRRSTIDPILSLDHRIREGLVNRKVVIVVFFDIKSAFDSVNHIQLLKTLTNMGVKGNMLTWLINFLSDRKIQVILEDKKSDVYNINKGVPQGSGISPLLFIALLTALPITFPLLSEEFADDLAFCITYDDMETAMGMMQDSIRRLEAWCRDKKLTLNPAKTKCMCFTRFTKPEDNTPRLFLGNEEIEVVKTFKYLGMVMDAPNLTWNVHLNKLRDDCNARLSIMRAFTGTTWGADRDCLLKIYIALIRSKLAYGSQALLAASPTNLNKLEVIENTALRIATGAWNNTNIAALHVEANIVPIKTYLEEQSLKYYFKLRSFGQQHPVNSQIFNDENTQGKIWTPGVFKKPFALRAEELETSWHIPQLKIPRVNMSPVLPPWFNIKENIHLDLDIHTIKAMGPTHNFQAALDTLNHKYANYKRIYSDGSKADDLSTGAACIVENIIGNLNFEDRC